MKKFISAFILISLTASVFLTPFPVSAYEYPNEYWKYHGPYNEAVKAGDTDEILRLGKIIIDLLKDEPYADVIPNLSEKYRVMYKVYRDREDYKNAVLYLKEYIKAAEFQDYPDVIKLGNAELAHLDIKPEVYAETSQTSHIPFYNAKLEPKNGIYLGRVIDPLQTYGVPYNAETDYNNGVLFSSDESIITFYARFFTENYKDFDWFISPYDNNTKVLNFAWNLGGENSELTKVLDSSSDQYIINNLKYLNSLKSPVMIRIFAEMNVWVDLADPANFKAAYIKVAKLARTYAPNAALVFSPNDISGWTTDISDYYPGDEYVDWVGVSLYTSKYFNTYAPEEREDFNESYYGNGVYANPILKLKDIVDRYGSKKPIIISEGATAYKYKSNDTDLTGFAAEKTNQLYSYISMVYPQVKAAIYFDKDFSGSNCLYSLAGNETVKNSYFSAVSQNPAANRGIASSEKSYIELNSLNDKPTSLNLATYVVYPNENVTSVTYSLNGKEIKTTSELPYRVSIDANTLSAGEHKISVKIRNGMNEEEKIYSVTKKADGTIQGATPAAAAPSLTAIPANSPTLVDGNKVELNAYLINQNNYLKLRDIAYILNGTEKQFEVGYDNATKAITLTSGKPYTATGAEMQGNGKDNKTPVPTASKIYLDGKELNLTVYTIDGNNYFKLRDIGAALNFGISWENGMVVIDTSKSYTDN